MSPLGKRVVVLTMLWVFMVMIGSQVYDNVTGRGMPARPAAIPTTLPTTAPDAEVSRLAELQVCVSTKPQNRQCAIDLADLYYNNKQYEQAQVNYERAVSLDPHDVRVLLRLAGTYIYQLKFSQAVVTLEQAVAIQPDSPEIHLLLGLSLSRLEPPQNERALEEWRRVITLAPDSPWAQQAQTYINETNQ